MDGIHFRWSEEKRAANLRKHGLDFSEAIALFAGPTVTFEDLRFGYSEPRYVTIGLLRGVPVTVVHTETTYEIRIISFRQATHAEGQAILKQIED